MPQTRGAVGRDRVPVGDIIELFNGRSNDYAWARDPGAMRSRQEVADIFQARRARQPRRRGAPFRDPLRRA
jgi:sulfonate transport system substrate-binding protein